MWASVVTLSSFGVLVVITKDSSVTLGFSLATGLAGALKVPFTGLSVGTATKGFSAFADVAFKVSTLVSVLVSIFTSPGVAIVSVATSRK